MTANHARVRRGVAILEPCMVHFSRCLHGHLENLRALNRDGAYNFRVSSVLQVWTRNLTVWGVAFANWVPFAVLLFLISIAALKEKL